MRFLIGMFAGGAVAVGGGAIALAAMAPEKTPEQTTIEKALWDEITATRADWWAMRQQQMDLAFENRRLKAENDALRRQGTHADGPAPVLPGEVVVEAADKIPPQSLPVPKE